MFTLREAATVLKYQEDCHIEVQISWLNQGTQKSLPDCIGNRLSD